MSLPLVSLMEQFEAGLLALLAPLNLELASGPDVEILPEQKAGIQEAIVRPRVTVAYRQSEFGTRDMPFHGGLVGVHSQREILHADVFIRGRGRAGETGVYAVTDAARRKLLGAVPFPGAERIWFLGQQFDEFEDRGAWRYALNLCTAFLVVSDFGFPEPAAEYPLFAFNLPPG